MGAFTYVGADLHLRFGLSFTAVRSDRGQPNRRSPLYRPVRQLVVASDKRDAIFGGVLIGITIWCWRSAPPGACPSRSAWLGFYALHSTCRPMPRK
jgi:hypothetical protein